MSTLGIVCLVVGFFVLAGCAVLVVLTGVFLAWCAISDKMDERERERIKNHILYD